MTDPITRIEAALGRLGEDHEPPVGWEARVLAAANASAHTDPAQRIDAAGEPITRAAANTEPTHRKWWWFAVPAFAVAAVTILVVRQPPKDQPLQVAYEVQKSGTVVRGSDATVGDVVHATATGGGRHRAVWIYRNDILLVACPGAAQCRSAGDSTIADITVRSFGEYKIVAVTSKSPVPDPKGNFDTDVANAKTVGTVKDKSFTVH